MILRLFYSHHSTRELSQGVNDLQLPSHWVKVRLGLRSGGLLDKVRLDGIQVDLSHHCVEEVANLRLCQQSESCDEWASCLTGRACHLPPPSSNQDKCPPRDVVTRTVYGLALISWYGMASSTAIYHIKSASGGARVSWVMVTDRVVQGRQGHIGNSYGKDRIR